MREGQILVEQWHHAVQQVYPMDWEVNASLEVRDVLAGRLQSFT